MSRYLLVMVRRRLFHDIMMRFAGLVIMACGTLCGMEMDRLKKAAAGMKPSPLEFGLAILCVVALFGGAAMLLCGVRLVGRPGASSRHSGD